MEQLAKELLSFLRLSMEKLLELILRKHDHLQKLRCTERKNLTQLCGQLNRLRRGGLPRPVDQYREFLFSFANCRAFAASLGDLVFGGSRDAIVFVAVFKFERHTRRFGQCREITSDAFRRVFVAWRICVEREGDGVEDAGFAGSRLAPDEEQTLVGKCREIDGLVPAERA